MFKYILKENLDIWVWLGDYAYVDQDVKERKLIQHIWNFLLMGKVPFKTIFPSKLPRHEDMIKRFNETYNNYCKYHTHYI